MKKNSSSPITLELTDRKLLLGLDYAFRERMKRFEINSLLPASRSLMSKLHIKPVNCPIEGYYSELPELSEYFFNTRSLQSLDDSMATSLSTHQDYQILNEVCSSAIFGAETRSGFFIQRLDPLYLALNNITVDHWQLDTIMTEAQHISTKSNDCSLVGMAALIGDSMVLAALRETVALYAAVAAGSAIAPPTYQYQWNVSPALEERASQFVSAFNILGAENLPEPTAKNAEFYYLQSDQNHIIGRCIRIGFDDSSSPAKHYHWAIRPPSHTPRIEEFWSEDIWTTKRYHDEKLYV